MKPFDINFLDHVAIYVGDMEISIEWYSRVLGLKKYKLEKWGEYPIFMLSGKSGVAIFPSKNQETKQLTPPNIRIDHFAFNVTSEDFKSAQLHFKKIEEPFVFKDHHYFQSIYLTDPDGHTVELTTIMVDDDTFYN